MDDTHHVLRCDGSRTEKAVSPLMATNAQCGFTPNGILAAWKVGLGETKLQTLPPKDLWGARVYPVKAVNPNGQVAYLFFRSDNGLVHGYATEHEFRGQRLTFYGQYGDYRLIDGIQLPFEHKMLFDEKTVKETYQVTELKLVDTVDEACFKVP